MSDDKTEDPINEGVEFELPIEEDEIPSKETEETADILEEVQNLGRQFGEAIRAAWHSEERHKLESDVREGLDIFLTELNKGFQELQQSDVAQKTKEEFGEVKEKVEASDLTHKAKSALAEGLRWLSSEFGNLANQFTPVEKSPKEDDFPPE